MVTKCPLCDFKYEKDSIKIIDKKDGAITIHLNCRRCKSSIMMVIIAGGMGITSVSAMTDIMENDFEKISNKRIEYDDVLEMHKFFQSRAHKPSLIQKNINKQ